MNHKLKWALTNTHKQTWHEGCNLSCIYPSRDGLPLAIELATLSLIPRNSFLPWKKKKTPKWRVKATLKKIVPQCYARYWEVINLKSYNRKTLKFATYIEFGGVVLGVLFWHVCDAVFPYWW